jgi:hypothetical protein
VRRPPTRHVGFSKDYIEVFAKHQITEAIYRYCRGLDRMDRSMARSIWHADAVVDYGPTFRGTALDFLDHAWAIHGTMLTHSHQISNILIELDGYRAASESYVTAALRSLGEGGIQVQLSVRGRYLDDWSYRDGGWRIDRRIFVHDFSDLTQVRDAGIPSPARRDAEDPSYRFLCQR